MKRLWLILAYLGLALLTCWYRGHTFEDPVRQWVGFSPYPPSTTGSEPLDCDEALYAFIGQQLSEGELMYLDLTEHKPPLGYWIYSVAVRLGGMNELSIRLMPLPFVLLTLTLVGWVGTRMAGHATGLAASGLFALTSTDPYVFGNGSNMEHFLNAWSLSALACLVKAQGERPRHALSWTFLAGICLGLGILVKQVLVAHLLIASIGLVLLGRDGSLTDRFFRVLTFGLGVGLALGLIVVILLAQGTFAEAWADFVVYGGALARETPPPPNAPSPWIRWLTGNADPRQGELPWPFGRTDYYVWWGRGAWPLWLLFLPGLAVFMRVAWRSRERERSQSDTTFWVLLWTIGAIVEVILPGHYWQHYYLLLTPMLSLVIAGLGSWSARGAFRQSPRGLLARMADLVILLVILAAVSWTTFIQIRDYWLVEPAQLTARYKGGTQWIRLRELGQEFARVGQNWDRQRLLVWGWQSPLFFYGDMDHVTPHVFVDPLMKAYADQGHPLVNPRKQRMMTDLRSDPPEVIFVGDPLFAELSDFLRDRYAGIGTAVGGDQGYWIRKDLPYRP